MRQIKFRGKDAEDKSNTRWYYGSYFKHLPYTPAPIRDKPIPEEDYQHMMVIDGFSDWQMPRGIRAVDIIPETVGEYTGIHDKNGHEIYEGDLLAHDDNHEFMWEVSYSDGGFNLVGIGLPAEVSAVLNVTVAKDMVVIGNIHDNPEMVSHE